VPVAAKPNFRAAALVAFVRHARLAGHKPPPKGPLPRQQPPDAIALEYAAALRGMVRRAIDVAYAPLLRQLPALVVAAKAARADTAAPALVQQLVAKLRGPSWRADDTERAARAAVAAAKERMGGDVDELAVRRAANKAAADVDAHNKRQLGKQVQAATGLDLLGEDGHRLRPIVDGFIEANVGLITDITPALAAKVQAAVLHALTTGQVHEDLAAVLEQEMGYAADRAQLIAIDQVGKLNSQINEKRQTDLGVTKFIWRSMGDERVAGNPAGLYPKATPSHWARDGQEYSWSDPPKDKGAPDPPGRRPRCRCHGEPVLDHLLDDLPDPGEEAGADLVQIGPMTPPAPAARPPVDLAALTRAAEEAHRQVAEQHAAARAAREAQLAAERAAWDARRAALMAGRAG
jgi:SPP1 gp7 family putative phage head morphogenesis protein